MAIRFLMDYQGQDAGPHYFRAGALSAGLLSNTQEAALVAAGRAEWATDAPVVDKPTMAGVDWTEVKGVGPEIAGALDYMGLTSKDAFLMFFQEHGIAGVLKIPAVGMKQARALIAYAERG